MRVLVPIGTSMSNPNGHSGCRKLTSESTTTSPVTSISSLPELMWTEMWPRAFLDAVSKSMRQIRTTIGATTINPALLTAAERIQYEGYLRRDETNAAILELSKCGATIKEIVRTTGFSRGLVRKVLRGQRSDVFRVRESSLEAYLPWLDDQWSAGIHSGAKLWRQLKQQGFRGCLRVVSEWAARLRRAEKV